MIREFLLIITLNSLYLTEFQSAEQPLDAIKLKPDLKVHFLFHLIYLFNFATIIINKY